MERIRRAAISNLLNLRIDFKITENKTRGKKAGYSGLVFYIL